MSSTSDATARVRRRLQRFLRVSEAEQAALELDARVRALEGSDLEWQALVQAHHETRMMIDHAVELSERATLLDGQYGLTLHDHDTRVGVLERLAAVRTVGWWVEQAVVDETVPITVVLPTRNRADLLPRAVGSVRRQVYGNWQLVMIDDGSTDDTAAVLGEIDDDRITATTIDHRGVSAARNAGLELATGELVTYLDDDNLMHPLWLKAVAWAFAQRPEIDVLYGARLADDARRLQGGSDAATDMPLIHFEPFERDAVRRGNLSDLGVLAHRAGLPEAHFDERLTRYGDWDLLLRLTGDTDPLELPMIACLYTTHRTDRISVTVDGTAELELIGRKLAGEDS